MFVRPAVREDFFSSLDGSKKVGDNFVLGLVNIFLSLFHKSGM